MKVCSSILPVITNLDYETAVEKMAIFQLNVDPECIESLYGSYYVIFNVVIKILQICFLALHTKQSGGSKTNASTEPSTFLCFVTSSSCYENCEP